MATKLAKLHVTALHQGSGQTVWGKESREGDVRSTVLGYSSMACCGRSSVKMAGLFDTRSNPYLVSTFSASACTRKLAWQVC